jgi:hypothetical protein
MFCPHCGAELAEPNQKFCHNCGTEVKTPSKVDSYKAEIIQPRPEPKTYYAPVTSQRKIGLPGKYSKLCLWLALTSVLIGIISLAVAYGLYRNWYWGYGSIGRIMIPIINLPIRIGGLIAGVFSKTNGSKAQLLEPYNDSEKAGSMFAIFGIIINAIGIGLILFGPFSIIGYM